MSILEDFWRQDLESDVDERGINLPVSGRGDEGEADLIFEQYCKVKFNL